MAKSKAPAKAKAKVKSTAPTLPSGYKVIGRAPNWDVEKNPKIAGVRGPASEVPFAPKKKGEKKRTVRTMVVTDETIGPVNVWESGMLRDLFDQTEEGDEISIEYLGLGEAKKGQNAPRMFVCGKKE